MVIDDSIVVVRPSLIIKISLCFLILGAALLLSVTSYYLIKPVEVPFGRIIILNLILMPFVLLIYQYLRLRNNIIFFKEKSILLSPQVLSKYSDCELDYSHLTKVEYSVDQFNESYLSIQSLILDYRIYSNAVALDFDTKYDDNDEKDPVLKLRSFIEIKISEAKNN